jgi:zinc transport system substrate-binding protein
LLCTGLLPLSACAGDADADGRLQVVASVYPLQYVAERLVGDHADVVDLVSPGQEPHDAELTVGQTAAVADADLVLRVAGLAPAVDEAVAQEADAGADVEALEVLRTREPAMGGARPVRVLGGDPHFWLDPRALATYAAEVQDRLVALDPQHADDYRQAGAELFTDLNALDGRMSTGLDDCERRTVVVSHEAYDYLGYRYDLDVSSLVGLSPEDEPSPATLAALQGLVRREGVTTVFYEPLAGPGPVESLAEDLGLEVAPLDPAEGLTDATAHEDYLSIMAADLRALEAAGGCTGAARS